MKENIFSLMAEKSDNSVIKKILKTSHEPPLKAVREKEGKLVLEKLLDGVFTRTKKEVYAKKVREFCYTEEELYHPVARRCEEKGLKLDAIQIDTKILRALYPSLDFDAYSFYPVGMGLNIDGLTRISGNLYKIQRRLRRGRK